MARVKLKTKFVVLLGSIILVSLCVNLLWTLQNQESQTERELVEQARALAANMDAVWSFMTINQDLINYDSQGNYEFKGLQCSIAGRSIGALFSSETDYVTRYVSLNPRNDSDEADAFEAPILALFAEDKSVEDYYSTDVVEDRQVFRYMQPMVIEESCLTCHGKPAGQIDETGYQKEGMEIGDLYGAISLQIPMSTYQSSAYENTVQNVTFAILLILACVLVIYLALSHLVTRPFGKLRNAMSKVEAGDFEARLDEERSSSEANDLVRGFNRMADELEGFYEGLEKQVDERTQEIETANHILETQRQQLEKMNERLRDENRYKSDFLAMMSHELKTPLTASMTFSGILESQYVAQSEEEKRLWREIEANNKTLLSLINNILEMARIDAGKEALHLEIVDVADIVGMIQYSIEPLAIKKGITLEYDIDQGVPLFVADPEKLRRITENLASNAIKFTPEQGTIKLTIKNDQVQSLIVIQISDNGIGIPEGDQKTIFDRFVQADSSSSRGFGGSGLGLALVKELVEMHHGTISVDSKVGKGSTFTVRIPSDARFEG